MKIYHNPRCSKSRQTLELLKSKTSDFEIIEYLKEPLDFDNIEVLLLKLGMQPKDLIRTGETIWKENYKGKELSDDNIIKAMVDNPKLIERPIVVHNNSAVIGRPPENILSLFA